MIIEDNYQPPASLEGHSCVYILHLRQGGSPETFYVGETESIRQRLQQHRQYYQKQSIGSQSNNNNNNGVLRTHIRCAVLTMPNKSIARQVNCTGSNITCCYTTVIQLALT